MLLTILSFYYRYAIFIASHSLIPAGEHQLWRSWCYHGVTVSVKVKNGEIKESTFSSDIIRPLIVRQKKTRDNAYLLKSVCRSVFRGALCHGPPFWLCLLAKKNKIKGAKRLKYARLFWLFFEVYGQGLIQGGRMRGSLCILSPAIFKNVFDVQPAIFPQFRTSSIAI